MAKCDKCETNEKHEPFNRCVDCIKYVMSKPDVIVNNTLAYINSYRHDGSTLKIQLACLKHFSDEEIELGKTLIYKENKYILGTPKNRVGSSKKTKSEFNLEDIFTAFETLDKKKIDICCVADNVKRLPKYNPEEVELSSILERIIKLENTSIDHGRKIDESYAREVKGNSIVEESKKDIIKAKNDVESCLKIVSDTMEDVKKHETNVETVKSELESVKLTYAEKAQQNRSHAQNVIGDEVSTGSSASDWQTVSRGSGKQSGSQQNRNNSGNGNRQQSRRSYYGTAAGSGSGVDMGAPLPSRFVVIERVKRHITKDRVKEYMGSKKTNIRSVKLMSKDDSMFKRYLLEISVQHLDVVVNEKFWPPGVRVRTFRGKGSDWRDTEVSVGPDNVAEVNEGENHSPIQSN